jgi:hypothetical protein
MPANDQPTTLSNLVRDVPFLLNRPTDRHRLSPQNLSDCTKMQLSELWGAIDRRRAAISIAAELNQSMLVERIGECPGPTSMDGAAH